MTGRARLELGVHVGVNFAVQRDLFELWSRPFHAVLL